MPYFYDKSDRVIRAYAVIEDSYKRNCPFCKFVLVGSLARCPRCDKIVEPLSRGTSRAAKAIEVPAAGNSK